MSELSQQFIAQVDSGEFEALKNAIRKLLDGASKDALSIQARAFATNSALLDHTIADTLNNTAKNPVSGGANSLPPAKILHNASVRRDVVIGEAADALAVIGASKKGRKR